MKDKIVKNEYFKVLILAFIIGVMITMPYIIKGNGILNIVDDWNLQQIPFNIQSNMAVKSGNVFWSWNTDLGSNFIGTYSFYTLGSIYFWLSCLFSPSFFPYLIGPLLILKFCIASLTSYAFMKRFVKNKKYAIIGSLLYAFSGYQITDMMFNHFLDVVSLFPLLLISFEEAIEKRRRGFFALVVALNAFTNFFFFIGEIVFLAIYFVSRLADKEFKKNISKSKIFLIVFEGILGVGVSCILFLPSIFFTLQNPRTQGHLSGLSAILYDPLNYINILKAFILSPEIASSRSILTPNSFTSTEAYLPVFGLVLVISYIFKNRKSWISISIYLSLLFVLVPILNSIFYAFNTTYYSRWFYMPILLMSLASTKALDEKNIKYKYGILGTVFLWIVFAVYMVYEKIHGVQVVFIKGYFIFYVLLSFAGLVVTYLILKIKKSKRFVPIALILVAVFSSIIGSFSIYGDEKLYPNSAEFNNVYTLSASKINLPKEENYRIDTLACYRNINLLWNTPSMDSFNSTVDGSLFDFYSSIGTPRVNATETTFEYYALRPFLSVKYIAVTKNYPNLKSLKNFGQVNLPNLKMYSDQGNYLIYESKDFIPMGYTFDYYMSMENYNKIDPKNRQLAYLKALVLDNNQISKYSDILKKIPRNKLDDLTQNAYFQDVKDRKRITSYYFERNNNGFVSKIKLDKKNLVFFSVPYDMGWSAKVNGKSVPIEKVDSGFMAVIANAGNNDIMFSYEPEGFNIGKTITKVSIDILIIYLAFYAFVNYSKRKRLN